MGHKYLYDPEKEVSKHTPIRDTYLYENENPKYNARMHQGFLRHAFIFTFYYLLLADSNCGNKSIQNSETSKSSLGSFYSKVMREVVSLGGDSDTNCCIVGALIGAYVDIENIEERMLSKVFSFDCTNEETLLYVGTKRPDFLNVGPYCIGVFEELLWSRVKCGDSVGISFVYDDYMARRKPGEVTYVKNGIRYSELDPETVYLPPKPWRKYVDPDASFLKETVETELDEDALCYIIDVARCSKSP